MQGYKDTWDTGSRIQMISRSLALLYRGAGGLPIEGCMITKYGNPNVPVSKIWFQVVCWLHSFVHCLHTMVHVSVGCNEHCLGICSETKINRKTHNTRNQQIDLQLNRWFAHRCANILLDFLLCLLSKARCIGKQKTVRYYVVSVLCFFGSL